jgi:hypothetical protein
MDVEFEMKPYIVYVKTDDAGRITAVNSSAFFRNADGWIEIDSGYGDRFHHAQGNYFPKPIMDDRGIKRYQAYPFVDAPPGEIIERFFKDGEEYLILERTQEEMDADYVEPVKEQDTEELLLEMAADHEYRLCLIELGVNEYDL